MASAEDLLVAGMQTFWTKIWKFASLVSPCLQSSSSEDLAMTMPEFQQIVNEAKKEIQEIDVPTLKKMQQGKEDFDLIDVRETDEYQRGAIPGAKHISRGVLERDIDQVTTDKNRKIVLYCGGGSRSALAALNLKKMGFKNPISLAGGWGAWKHS